MLFNERIRLIENGLQTVNQTLNQCCMKFEQRTSDLETKKDKSDTLWSTIATMPKQITAEIDKISSSVRKHTQELVEQQNRIHKGKG